MSTQTARRVSLLAWAALAATASVPVAGQAASTVGALPGQLEVTPAGAASYRIPLFTAAGANGLRPELALAYHSRAGDGLAGVGWRLAGLSEITRCGLSLATDGERSPVRHDARDRFCLDGVPLLAISGTYGAAGTEYRTEIHAQQRVRSHGSHGSGAAVGPAWFEVEHPGGLVYRYGHEADSRIAAAGRSDGAILRWSLDEVRDRFGMRMLFSYAASGAPGEHLVQEIHWTLRTGQQAGAARYRLRFEYEPRPASDLRSGFTGGSPWSQTRRLSRIRYQFRDGSTFNDVHSYSLAYSSSGTGRGRLASITPCGSSECLAPTTLLWTNGSSGWGTESSGPAGLAPGQIAFGDYNGDGATDLLAAIGGRWQLLLADPATGRYLAPRETGITATGGRVIPLEINGDGLTDILLESAPASGTWRAYTSGADGQFTPAGEQVLTDALGLQPIDTDGDGLDDLVYVSPSAMRVMMIRNHGGVFQAPHATSLNVGGPPGTLWRIGAGGRRADFDGDGRQDLLLRLDGQSSGPATALYRAHLSTGNDFASYPLYAGLRPAGAALLADVNGDGLTDLVLHDPTIGRWEVMLSSGAQPPGVNTGLHTASCSNSPLSTDRWWQARIVDHDGDGRADLLLPSGTGWRVHRSDGSCFHATQRTAELAGGTGPVQAAVVATPDLTGNGLADLVFLRTEGSLRLRRRNGTAGDLLWRTADGLGNVALLQWEPLSGSSRYHVDPSIEQGTVGGQPTGGTERLLRGGALQVVTGVHRTDGRGGHYATLYRYWNARQSLWGRGFLGFARVRASDERDASCQDSAYLQRFPFTGRLRAQTAYQPDSRCDASADLAAVPRSSDYTADWAQYPALSDGPRTVHRTAEQTRHYEVGSGQLAEETRRSWQYDPVHGAAREEVVERSSPQWQGARWRTVTTRQFAEGLRSAYWCLGRPERVDVRREQPGAAPAMRTVRYQYDPASGCAPGVELEGPPEQPDQVLKTTWTRHSTGRVTGILHDSASGLAQKRRVSIGWDSWGLRPVTLTAVIDGQPNPVVTQAWHYGFGLPVREVDPQGRVTETNRDDFGRVRERSGPGGNGATISRLPCTDGGCWAAGQPRYRVREQRADGFWTETQYDSLDRVVAETRRLPGSSESRQAFAWDAFGRMARESQPYLTGAPVFWTTYERDQRGRITLMDEPVSEAAGSGRITRVSYSQLSMVIEDPAGRHTTRVHDPDGRLLFVMGPLGSMAAYGYTPFGELESIWDAGWSETRLEHDARGRLTRLRHPDSGTWIYNWNIFGELVSQQDDRTPASVISWDYDQLGRLRQRSEAEGITTWTYQASAGGGFGLPQQVTGPTDLAPDGYRETWQYDPGSLPLEVEVQIDGRRYLTSRRYDALGRLQRVIYPEAAWGMRAEFVYGYADSGHLDEIAQEIVGYRLPVYRVTDRDALGRAVHTVQGTGAVSSRREFDRAHLRPTAIHSERLQGTVLQDYRYAWDLAGNLESRQDALQSLTENFTHDALDRLTAVSLNGSPSLSLSYAANGNLLFRSDTGNYSYLPDRPRAVSRISGGPRGTQLFGYDANGNMTSRNGGTLHWTSFNKPREINRSGNGCSGECSRFVYGPDRQRIKQQVRSGGAFRTLHYAGRHFEAEYLPDGHVRYQMHVPADGGVVLTQRLDTVSSWESWFVLRDHLGSVDRLVRDFGTDPSAFHPQSFDALGKRRFADWRADPADTLRLVELRSRRGFTDHEHLDRLGLIHMNGRLYDPVLGRMLSPDPVLGQPNHPQSLNAYSYAWNSPLRLIDPDGFEAVDFNNFRPDPVHFQHSSMKDAFGRAAELWAAGWAGVAVGSGSAYLVSRAYQGYMGINPAYRELLAATALEIAQGVVIAAQPLDGEVPDTAPLPEPVDVQRPDERDPRQQSPQVHGNSGVLGGITYIPSGWGSLPLPLELPGTTPWFQYSFVDDTGGLTTRITSGQGGCRDCHGDGEATQPHSGPPRHKESTAPGEGQED